MSFFSEERGSELKDLFFESAGELLQALNEEGMDLEKRPGDVEVVRQVRRTIHTLKGDSAACGFRELSELAHELEDVLTPELAARSNGRVAEVVLAAADTFEIMLSAYRANAAAPNGDTLRVAIRNMVNAPLSNGSHHPVTPQKPCFQWSEYEQMVIADAARRGLKVLQLSMVIDRDCPMRAVAVQMVRNALSDLGTLLAISPDENAPADALERIEAALATSYDAEHISRKCRIPAMISEVKVERYTPAAHAINGHDQSEDILEEVLFAEEAAFAPQFAAIEPEQPSAIEGTTDFVQAIARDEAAAAQQNSVTNSAAEIILRVDAEKIDAVLNLVGEMIIGKSMLTQTINEFDKKHTKDPLRAKFADALAYQARVLNDLQKSVMKVRMVPVEQLFRRFPRVVRDTAKACGKEVQLVMNGQDTDLDKSILDVLAEPLAHLVRNCIDHGIELPIDRMAAGKPTQGRVRLNAFHQGNQVVIEVSDDGKGIDRNRVVEKAIERGVATRDEVARMTEGEMLNLVFHPGLSTSDQVTAISGRGVGMDVVKTVLEKLKGSVSIESRPGQGSTFLLKVPLTLAIIKALLFRIADRLYAVPLTSVMEITRAQEIDIHRVDQHEVLRLRDQVLTLVRLSKLNKTAHKKSKKIFIVVIAIGDRRFGLVVDKLVGEEELVIKALDDHLVATELVSGASILGDGTVVLILNLNSVVARLGKSSEIEHSIGASA